MSTLSGALPPDRIDPQSPAETPPATAPAEPSTPNLPEFTPLPSDTDVPERTPPELPAPDQA